MAWCWLGEAQFDAARWDIIARSIGKKFGTYISIIDRRGINEWQMIFTLVPLVLFGVLALDANATPGHGYISVAPPAFRPTYDTTAHRVESTFLRKTGGGDAYFHADIQLPDGATVTKLTFYWDDSSAANGYCTLWRTPFALHGIEMAKANTDGETSVRDSSEDDTIFFAVVDNSSYAYGLTLYLPDSGIDVFGAIVEYTYPVSLPLVFKSVFSR